MTQLNRLNFQQLLYLEALVHERHVTRAAERMGIGQPAMSAALARMREVFKDVLLVKTSSGMQPTPRAIDLAKRVREISLLMNERGGADESFDLATSQASWRIMASDGTARTLLPSLMEAAGKQAPKMSFSVQAGDPRRVFEYLREGQFDLALSFVRKPTAELRQMVLYPQGMVCIARKGHPSIKGKLTLKQFVEQDHARWDVTSSANATLEEIVDESLARQGHARKTALTVANLTLLPAVIAQSNLLAVVPEHLAHAAVKTLQVQSLPLPFPVSRIDVSMIWHERAHQDPAHKWLRNSLRDIGKALASRPLPTV